MDFDAAHFQLHKENECASEQASPSQVCGTFAFPPKDQLFTFDLILCEEVPATMHRSQQSSYTCCAFSVRIAARSRATWVEFFMFADRYMTAACPTPVS